jgi:hypothetical protein
MTIDLCVCPSPRCRYLEGLLAAFASYFQLSPSDVTLSVHASTARRALATSSQPVTFVR